MISLLAFPAGVSAYIVNTTSPGPTAVNVSAPALQSDNATTVVTIHANVTLIASEPTAGVQLANGASAAAVGAVAALAAGAAYLL